MSSCTQRGQGQGGVRVGQEGWSRWGESCWPVGPCRTTCGSAPGATAPTCHNCWYHHCPGLHTPAASSTTAISEWGSVPPHTLPMPPHTHRSPLPPSPRAHLGLRRRAPGGRRREEGAIHGSIEHRGVGAAVEVGKVVGDAEGLEGSGGLCVGQAVVVLAQVIDQGVGPHVAEGVRPPGGHGGGLLGDEQVVAGGQHLGDKAVGEV